MKYLALRIILLLELLLFPGTILAQQGRSYTPPIVTPGGSIGQLQVNLGGNSSGGITISGDGTLNTATGVLTISGTGGIAFAPSATIDTTNASNITSGILSGALLPNPTAATLGGIQSQVNLAHQFLTGISTAGIAQLAQPAVSDISGIGSLASQNSNALNVTGVTLLTGLPLPVGETDAANKQYVDDAATGLIQHPAVAAATLAGLLNAPTYNNAASGVGATLSATSDGVLVIDGYTVLLNDRVLVQYQVDPTQNGCYTETTVGTVSVAYVLTRCVDFNTAVAGNVALGSGFFVEHGTVNGSAGFILTTAGVISLGTTALNFTQNSASLQYQTDGTTLALNGNVLSVLAGGISNTQLAAGAAQANLGSLFTGHASLDLPLTGGSLSGALHLGTSTLDGSAIAFTGGTLNGITIGATTASTGKFTTITSSGSTTLNSLGVTTGSTFTGNITANASALLNGTTKFGTDTTAASPYVNGPAGANRYLNWSTASVRRWSLYENSTAESGGNVGSDLCFKPSSDAGGLLGDSACITRSTGAWTFTGAATFNGVLASVAVPVAPPSMLACSGCDLTGATYTPSATINAFFNANAGATIQCPANTLLKYNDGNVSIPNATSLFGQGGPLGATHRGAPHTSCVIEHDRTHTLILNSGSILQDVTVKADDLIANPSPSQVNAAVAAWGADSDTSNGIYVTSSNGAVINRVYTQGFKIGTWFQGNGGAIRDLEGDDWLVLYNASNNLIDHVEAQPWYCLASSNCNTDSSARPGTAVYSLLATGSMHHINCEQFAQGVYLSAAGGAMWANDITCEINQPVFSAANLGTGFGMSLVRVFGVPDLDVRKSYAHGYPIEYQIEPGNQGTLIDSFQSQNQTSNTSAFVAPVVIAPNNATGTLITLSGTAPSSSVTVGVSSKAVPPAFAVLASVAGGSLAATTYYVELTYVDSGTGHETTASNELSLAVAANNLLTVNQPPPWSGVDSYNVYMSTTPGAEKLQNASPITLVACTATPCTNPVWTEPTSGLVTGLVAPPVSNNTSWSVSHTYTISSTMGFPGPTPTLSNTAQYLEIMLNTDLTLAGNHVNAMYVGATLSVYGIAEYPPITVTATSTGGITIATSTAVDLPTSTGTIRDIQTLSDPYPTVLKVGVASIWQYEDFPISSSGNPIQFYGTQIGYDQFVHPSWSLLPTLTGNGCTKPLNHLNSLHGLVAMSTLSTGCGIGFGATLPFPPICSATNISGGTDPVIGTVTPTGFSWTNAAPLSTQTVKYDCVLD